MELKKTAYLSFQRQSVRSFRVPDMQGQIKSMIWVLADGQRDLFETLKIGNFILLKSQNMPTCFHH